ncbi:MAG TPA: alpha/beta fold hydrolase [Gemmatimonadaceae bacterium]|nr:alpha/beta fold hydrolase [Gemmatimonadaceae bacterium]
MTGVQFDVAALAMRVGQTRTLNVTVMDAVGGTLLGRAVAWSSSDAGVVSVTDVGTIAAISPGLARVSATVEGKTASLPVTVTPIPAGKVMITLPAAVMYVGGTIAASAFVADSAGKAITGRPVAWSTPTPTIITVSSGGAVIALSPGTAQIIAQVEGVSDTASITVSLVPVASVTVSPATAILYLGQAVDLGAVAKDSAGNTLTGRAITWSSSDAAVAAVSPMGVVTAIAPGTVTITAAVEGKTGTASIWAAVVPVRTVTLSQGDATLYPTVTLDYDASAVDSAGNTLTGRPVSWSSGNTSVVTVSSTGLVTAIAQGEATITASVEGKPASARVTVRHDPIVFVHGFSGNAGVWSSMTSRFATDGWRSADLVGWSYNSLQSNVTSAASLKATIDSLLNATGAKRVDIITHSMGGLSSRYYLRNLDGSKVDAWVSLGGPNHGTDTANLCSGTYVSCAEMVIGSSFLTALNAGDETPGSARYATWWSPCDTTINPDDTVGLAGAGNTQTACLGHSALYTDATVYAQVREWVR